MRKYRLLARKGQGTFSEVLKAQNVKTSETVAIKCLRNSFESIDQVRATGQRSALAAGLLVLTGPRAGAPRRYR